MPVPGGRIGVDLNRLLKFKAEHVCSALGGLVIARVEPPSPRKHQAANSKQRRGVLSDNTW